MRGIVNFFPYGSPSFEAPGNMLVIVDLSRRGSGIAEELLAEADSRWSVNLHQQNCVT